MKYEYANIFDVWVFFKHKLKDNDDLISFNHEKFSAIITLIHKQVIPLAFHSGGIIFVREIENLEIYSIINA